MGIELSQIQNEEEALIILSSLGFCAGDWPFIERVGGPMRVLGSGLLDPLIERAQSFGIFFDGLNHFRRWVDELYASDGNLMTPVSHKKHRLFTHPHAPLVFFLRYNRDLVDRRPQIAIVGSRRAASNAVANVMRLASMLTDMGVVVISGGACGIDQAAHFGALKNQGSTILMAGTVLNPKRDESCFRSQRFERDQILVIHPFHPLQAQRKYMFVRRNFFVVAMSDAVVIAQGQKGSGTLYTAEFARDQGVLTYAMVGDIEDPLFYVPNRLVADGRAHPLVNFDQFIDSLLTKSIITSKSRNKKDRAPVEAPDKNSLELPGVLRLIYDHKGSLSFDEILYHSKRSVAELQRELLEFELLGRISKQGSQFVLTGN